MGRVKVKIPICNKLMELHPLWALFLQSCLVEIDGCGVFFSAAFFLHLRLNTFIEAFISASGAGGFFFRLRCL